MQVNSLNRSGNTDKSPVLMVPSSSSTSRQWDSMAASLNGFPILPFELHGHGASGAPRRDEPLTLEQEAARILDAVPENVSFHLIGHSYGGGVALKFATSFSHRVESLTLIEPSCFQLLKQSSYHSEALRDIQGTAEKIIRAVERGDHHSGMQHFIDYWCGAGTWAAFSENRKLKFAQLAIYVCHHFQALFEEPATLEDYAQLKMPTLIICGTHSPKPARLLTRLINESMPNARHATIPWAGHMSPITHPADVNRLIREHIANLEKGGNALLRLASEKAMAHAACP
jgi:pimeloyl-ACP methyl ester carboxylesterase